MRDLAAADEAAGASAGSLAACDEAGGCGEYGEDNATGDVVRGRGGRFDDRISQAVPVLQEPKGDVGSGRLAWRSAPFDNQTILEA